MISSTALPSSGRCEEGSFCTPPDLRWENLVAMKVNSWLGVNIEFTTIYDQDLSDLLQIKESLSLGFSFRFV